MDKHTALKQYFGHMTFRPGQEEGIDALLSGRDVLGVMPTGAGKSMCYQIPAILLDGVTMVVSPLISLMKDQVASLSQAGVPASFLNSSLSKAQRQEVMRRAEQGRYKMIYVAPERLEAPDFLRFASHIRISLLAVDEAHCVSQWGQDFRPSYLKIPDFIEGLPHRPAVGAFTATATSAVKEDIVRMLHLRHPLVLTTGFDRPNLYFDVKAPKNKMAFLLDYLGRNAEKSGIIYCATRKGVELVCHTLRQNGISVTRYHAGLDPEERQKNQEDFACDRKHVMAATNAFGMGINKSNVGFVLHYNMPKDLESYYQEAGRAGRDGEPADCILLFSFGDVQTAQFLLQSSSRSQTLARTAEERARLLLCDMERLHQMTAYCKTTNCFRTYILNYFGEKHSGVCGNCGNCKSAFIPRDITLEAQKILSAVARVEKRYPRGLGITAIVRMLSGSRDQRVAKLCLDKLPTYGIMRGVSQETIRKYIYYLISGKYLELVGEPYPSLRRTGKAAEVLFHDARVTMSLRKEPALDHGEKGKKGRFSQSEAPPVSNELLSVLKDLRTKLAQEANVPAYIIFSNATLSDMAAKKPRTIQEFRNISGVGEVKAHRYGKAFLYVIQAFETDSVYI